MRKLVAALFAVVIVAGAASVAEACPWSMKKEQAQTDQQTS